MTVANSTYKVKVEGDGSVTSFSFSPMVINESSHLEVTLLDSDGDETVLTEGTGSTEYTVVVSEFPGTGSITYPSTGATRLASSEFVTMRRVVPFEQDTDLENQGGYFPEVQEDQFDLFAMMDLKQQEELDRSIKFPVSDGALTVELPIAADRASKFLAFGVDGGVTVSDTVVPDDVIVSTFMETVLDDATATAALTTLSPSGEFVLLNAAANADDEDIINVRFQGENDAAETITYVRFETEVADASDGTENARLKINLIDDGTEKLILKIGPAEQAVLTSINTGAGGDPNLILDRDSASPGDNDLLGQVIFRGRNDAAEEINYATITCTASDVTDGTEDGYFRFVNMKAGSEVTSLSPGVLTSEQATTSGTEVDFTIPSNTRRLTVMFDGVSTDGTNEIIVQLGDAGGVETSGYLANASSVIGSTAAEVPFTAGFAVNDNGASSDLSSGALTLNLMDTTNNTWVASGNLVVVDTGVTIATVHTAGIKSLSSSLTTVRITTNGTPDDFTAGAVAILIE